MEPIILDKAVKKTGGAGAVGPWTYECWDAGCSAMFTGLHESGICTIVDRARYQGAQCKLGVLGLCCRFCLQGPCRINPMGK